MRLTSNTTLLAIVVFSFFITLTGFECASTEMTSAKLAIKNKDYAKAEALLQKEVAARPNNAEAYSTLGALYFETERFVDMANAYSKALAITPNNLKPEELDAINGRKYNGWINYYNKFTDTYNKIATGDKSLLPKGIAYLDSSEMMRPDYADNWFSKGSLQDLSEDENGASVSYQKYISLVKKDLDKGLEKGLAVGMTPEQVSAKLGEPTTKKIDKGFGYTNYANNDLYVYFIEDEKTKNAVVEGWKFFSDAAATPAYLKQTSTPLRSSAFYYVGIAAYRAGEKDKSKYDEAIQMLQYVQKMEPARNDVNNIIADSYVKAGKINEAKTALEKQISSDPNDPAAYLNYGNLLFNMKDYYGAASKFQNVLKLNLKDDDNRLQTALYNLGAAYKNIGGNAMDSLRKVLQGKEPKANQLDLFEKPLRESAKYFERLKSIKGKQTDFSTLVELGNLYDVLNEKDKIKGVVKELEAAEGVSNNASNGSYWRAMSRLYVILGDEKKATDADTKASKFGN